MTANAVETVRHILLATDFSASSDAALRVARDYARHFGARLHILHVVRPGEEPTVPPPLSKLAQDLGSNLSTRTAVESGSPASEIVRYAERHGVDLIVVGTHGRTGVTRALLGSVAERVVRTAPCPVLSVPREPRGPVAVEAAALPTVLQRCLVCGAPSEDLICEPCRARIRGEALARKLREERAGRS